MLQNVSASFTFGAKQALLEERKNVVVIVEDNASASRAIQRVLRAAGFFVISFPSAEALLETRAATAAACLVLDIGLPGLSGFELYQRLIETGTKLPVIFITGHDNSLGFERAREVEAIAYLWKPFAGRELMDAVTRALSLGKGNAAS
jgi:FixJ family two-component response regulator